MGKSRPKRQSLSQRRQENDDWTVKPLNENQLEKKLIDGDHDDDHQQQYDEEQPNSSPNSCKGRNFSWVSRKRGGHAGKHVYVPKSEVGGSSSGKRVGVEVVEEGKSEAKERNCVAKKEKEVVVVEEVERVGVSEGGVDDVVTRLLELQLGVEDVELSEEEMSINDQAQEDELLAMESIYGDNVYVLDKQQGLRSFQIHIHIELPKEFTVATNLRTHFPANSRVNVADEFLYTFKVKYLPPLVLTCLLPRSYPSCCPPSFTISVQWLRESRISKLCSMLDSLWHEQPGLEILYQWVEWLHSSSLPYLGFGEELVLGPYCLENDSDRRALSGSISPDVDIPSLRSYNEERQHENFLNSCHECCICFSEYAGTEFLRLPCHHFFCVKCMKTYADLHVKEGTVNKLQCPNTKCGGMIPPGLLKRLLGDEEFERWESLMLQKTLDAMSDVTYCPRCETACVEDGDDHAQCSKCLFSFCTLCRDRRHVGTLCMTPEMKLQILEERQNSTLLKDAQRIREREMINEILSVKEILRDAKQCPSCKMAISRTGGCNKMVCENCGHYFCYRCNKEIDGYDHFREGECQLFPEDAVQQWEAQMNEHQLEGQIRAQILAKNSRPCPNCRQPNAKEGNNNHIFCWACQNHYCFLCLKGVRRSSEHYGPRGCKQHTVTKPVT